MNILVINSGSSTVRYQLINMDGDKVLVKGKIDRIGDPGCEVRNHKDAVMKMFDGLKSDGHEIHGIGHRVVHGGPIFTKSTIVTDENIKQLESISHLAPLHNPGAIAGIRACIEVLPNIKNVMVFDTSFHATIEKRAFLYGLPLEDYEKHGIRRYGFHGTSHDYISKKCAELYGKPREELKIITCHIGTGASICAIKYGKSVETSMGLTPLEGLVMGTRSGDIDPAAIQYLMQAHNFTIEETINYLNKNSGLKGLADMGTSDMRDLIAVMPEGYSRGSQEVIPTTDSELDKNAVNVRNALDVYYHRITKYIGAYAAVMNGVDAIAWTGGIGNNLPILHENVHDTLGHIGAEIDKIENRKHLNDFYTTEISAPDAKVRTFIINTDEELEIAKQTVTLLA